MLADVAIHLAAPEDARRIAELSRELIEYGLPWRWHPERIRRAMKASDTNVVVTGPLGSPEGFGIMEYGDEDAHLLLFAVEKGKQRRGIGSALLVWLEEAARAAGAQRIRVEARRANLAARCFYNEHAYHESKLEKAMYSEAVDGIRLEKWLRPPSARPLAIP